MSQKCTEISSEKSAICLICDQPDTASMVRPESIQLRPPILPNELTDQSEIRIRSNVQSRQIHTTPARHEACHSVKVMDVQFFIQIGSD